MKCLPPYLVAVILTCFAVHTVTPTDSEVRSRHPDVPTDASFGQPDSPADGNADAFATGGPAPPRTPDKDLDDSDVATVAESPSRRNTGRRHSANHRRRHRGEKRRHNKQKSNPELRDVLVESEVDSENPEPVVTEQTTNNTKTSRGSDRAGSGDVVGNLPSVPTGRLSVHSADRADPEEMSHNEAPISTTPTAPANVGKAVHTPVTGRQLCPKCGDKDKQKELQIALVKQTLLKKLGLSAVPKVDGPIPRLPFDFYLGDDFTVGDAHGRGEHDEGNSVKTREIFVFANDVTHKCAIQKSSGCYSFDLDDHDIDADDVASVELWIYKQTNLNDHHIQTFMVSELSESNNGGNKTLRHRNIVKRIETRLKYGWMKVYVRRTVTRWLQKPHRNHGLAVVCKTCQRQNYKTLYGYKKGLRPILVFYMKNDIQSRRRYRRDTQCIEGGNNCCHKEALEINFRDIGWDYIMAPESIRPNFCTGSCNGIQAAYYNHTRVVQTLQQSVIHEYGAELQPCCSPTAFQRPQSLIYRDDAGVVRKIDMPDLLVSQCGCT